MTEKPEGKICIVGAGPAGLFLGARLAQAGMALNIIERSTGPKNSERPVLLYPPSIHLLKEMGLFPKLDTGCVQIKRIKIHLSQKSTQTIDLESITNGSIQNLVSVPYHALESNLIQVIREKQPDAFRWGTEVDSIGSATSNLLISGKDSSGSLFELKTDFLAGCDGLQSVVRRESKIAFLGSPFRDTFASCVFENDTSGDMDIHIFPNRDGLVESIPCCGHHRSWIVQSYRQFRNATINDMMENIRDRTGIAVNTNSSAPIVSSGTQCYRAEKIAAGLVCLAGDSAHSYRSVHAIGLNSGWLDARDLAEAYCRIFFENVPAGHAFALYETQHFKRSTILRKRTSYDVFLGRRSRYSNLKRLSLRLLLTDPVLKRTISAFLLCDSGEIPNGT